METTIRWIDTTTNNWNKKSTPFKSVYLSRCICDLLFEAENHFSTNEKRARKKKQKNRTQEPAAIYLAHISIQPSKNTEEEEEEKYENEIKYIMRIHNDFKIRCGRPIATPIYKFYIYIYILIRYDVEPAALKQ